VFWFQGVPFEPSEPGGADPEVLARLVAMYRSLEPDLLCLQEVQTAGVFDGLCERLAMRGAWRPGGLMPQYGGALLSRDVRPVADSRDEPDPPERMWQIGELDGVRVANVHLPSSRHMGEERASEQRLHEMGRVIDYAPDVIAGDFNEQPGGPLGEFLRAHAYEDAAMLTNRADLGTTYKGRRGDQIWISTARQSHLAGYNVVGIEKMLAGLPGKTYLSDHFPLWIDLRTEN
jgi:endonuclease/exonuclease/phosphatase family metal-dependent hydrolase